MKKLFLLLFLLLPINVSAKDLILNKMEILNGILSPEFNCYNTEYTVEIPKSVSYLEIDAVGDNDTEILVENNANLENQSIVNIVLKDNKNTMTYNLHILKEETSEEYVFQEITPINNEKFIAKNRIYIIPLSCIILIIITYKIIFFKRKHKK